MVCAGCMVGVCMYAYVCVWTRTLFTRGARCAYTLWCVYVCVQRGAFSGKRIGVRVLLSPPVTPRHTSFFPSISACSFFNACLTTHSIDSVRTVFLFSSWCRVHWVEGIFFILRVCGLYFYVACLFSILLPFLAKIILILYKFHKETGAVCRCSFHNKKNHKGMTVLRIC